VPSIVGRVAVLVYDVLLELVGYLAQALDLSKFINARQEVSADLVKELFKLREELDILLLLLLHRRLA